VLFTILHNLMRRFKQRLLMGDTPLLTVAQDIATNKLCSLPTLRVTHRGQQATLSQ
jgi:hypothetical protein